MKIEDVVYLWATRTSTSKLISPTWRCLYEKDAFTFNDSYGMTWLRRHLVHLEDDQCVISSLGVPRWESAMSYTFGTNFDNLAYLWTVDVFVGPWTHLNVDSSNMLYSSTMTSMFKSCMTFHGKCYLLIFSSVTMSWTKNLYTSGHQSR